ncbi:hypothetical protein BU17DRAFT_71685 [Hysterangium stoloniferum]|nr:hypothetical protein BU17DRAFT_71685 [Hysterangium stoloniferum]
MLAYLLRFSYQFTVYLRDYIMSNENGKFLFHRENGTFADTRKGTKISIIDASSCVTMDKNPDRITVERVEFNKMGLNFWGLRTMSHVMDRIHENEQKPPPRSLTDISVDISIASSSQDASDELQFSPDGTTAFLEPWREFDTLEPLDLRGIREPFPLSKLVTLVKVVRLQAVDYTIIPNQVKTDFFRRNSRRTKAPRHKENVVRGGSDRGDRKLIIAIRAVRRKKGNNLGDNRRTGWCGHQKRDDWGDNRGNWVLVNFLFCLIAKRSPWVPKAASLRTCYNHSKKRSNEESEDRRKENERLEEENKRLEEMVENGRKRLEELRIVIHCWIIDDLPQQIAENERKEKKRIEEECIAFKRAYEEERNKNKSLRGYPSGCFYTTYLVLRIWYCESISINERCDRVDLNRLQNGAADFQHEVKDF